jgi:hypothetical protein
MRSIIEYQCFGPIISYIHLIHATDIEIEQYETYQKMSFRNRFQLLSPHGVQNLSIPLLGGRDQKGRLITDIEIDYKGRWLAEQWRSFESWYNRSPFFFHYGPGVKAIFDQRPKLLSDLAIASQRWVLRQLGWSGTLGLTSQWVGFYELPGQIADLRNQFLPRNRQMYSLNPYQQVFGPSFESNLSILDLLFNLGPQARNYLLNQI